MKRLALAALILVGPFVATEAQWREFDAAEGLPVQVIEPSLEPVSGAVVQLFAVEDPHRRRCDREERVDFAVTGERGEAVLRLREAGNYCLFVDLDGFAPVWVGPFEIEPLEAPRINLIVPVKILLPPTIQGSFEWPRESGRRVSPGGPVDAQSAVDLS